MPLSAWWRASARAVWRRDELDRDLALELAAWVDELAARHEAAGLSPAEARRRALVETEGLTQVGERVREACGRSAFDPDTLGRWGFDVRTAMRAIRVAPAPAAVAVVTLAAAVGINLAMYGLIDRALLSPPANVADPSRVFTVSFHDTVQGADATRVGTSYPTFTSIRDQVPALSAVAAFQRLATSAIIEGTQLRANAMLVTGSYFETLGSRPMLGQGILPDGDMTGAASPVVVLSDSFWRSAFGHDRGVLGRHINIRGTDYVVSGVMPAGFSGHSSTSVDMWIPFASFLRGTPGWDRDPTRSLLWLVARLAPGQLATTAEVQAARAVGQTTRLTPIIGADVAATSQRVAWWLAGVSVLVLLIGLANAATLLVVRASRRRRDMTIRLALGASTTRLVRQAALEALALAVASISLSCLFALWMDEAVRRVLFPDLVVRAGLSGTAAVIAAIAGIPVFLVAAVANSWHLQSVSQPGRPSSGRSHGRTRTMTALLVAQTSISVLLLAGAAMFGQSLYKLGAQDFGMNLDHVVLVQFEQGAGAPVRGGEALAGALDAVRALPGIEVATVVNSLPFGPHNVPPISVPGRAEPPAIGHQLPFLNAATPEFLRILDVRIAQGRGFVPGDEQGAPVVIVNETMAREIWPGERAVGKCIRIGFDADFDPATAVGFPTPSANLPCRQVIGVAHDVRQRWVVPVDDEARLMQYYVPFSQVPKPPFAPLGSPVAGLLLRTTGPIETLVPAIRRLVVGQRTDLPFVRVVPYRQLLDRQLQPWELGTTLLGLFSLLAVVVAAVGLYAAFAHAVAERRREMAIRLAIGAQPGDVRRLVLREAAALAIAGVVIGSGAALLAGRWMTALLFETAPSDPAVLLSTGPLMLIVAIGATLVPALKASRADPNSLLRVE